MRSAKPRDLALSSLNTFDRRLGVPERHLDRALDRAKGLNNRDRAFAVNLVRGTLRWRLRLDWIIQQAVHFPFHKIDPSALNILRIALYQVFFMDRVPASAAVNEAVHQAKVSCPGHVVGFVNGILREICRKKEEIPFPDPDQDPIQHLSVVHSYPRWVVEKWIAELGMDPAEQLLVAGNRIPPLIIRTNGHKVGRWDLISRLKAEGISGSPTPYSPDGIIIQGQTGAVNRLKAFKAGLFQVQGEAAQVCSHLLAPSPGETVLDMCAGLGGKTMHLAQLMQGRGRILALDRNHTRLVSLAQSARRLGAPCVYPVVGDAALGKFHGFHGPFDKILVDAPCSGLGVISRHPDGKWIRNQKDVERLAHLQKAILRAAVPLLGKGGRMLYVVCTLSAEESQGVVLDFLETAGEMILEDLNRHAPPWAKDLIDEQGFLRTFPHVHGMDGFFGALFAKREA
jgi:16S rRNA (cytosine967-C5)-methyltransferase